MLLFLFYVILFLAVVAGLVLAIPVVRRFLVTNHILKLFRKMLPQISQTEQEALDAGTVWWEGDLFSGKPDWKKMLAYPKPTLTAEEQAFLDGPVEQLCAMLDEWKITHELKDLPPEVWQFIKEKGFFSLIKAAKGMPIGATVSFSSVAGRFGNNGQSDYSSANDLLCKISSSMRTWRPETRGIAIDWTAWGQIGICLLYTSPSPRD